MSETQGNANCQGFLDSSLVARVGETVTLRDARDNQVAIFTFMRTRQGGRRNPDEVARLARLCAAAPELAEYVKEKADNGCEEAAKLWRKCCGDT